LIGDSSKAKKMLGWYSKTPLEELVRVMIASDLEQINSTASNKFLKEGCSL
jgi:GDP-D-mannose dehydratase